MIEAVTRVPLFFNDGQRVPEQVIDGIFARFLAAFGGFSVEGESQGYWVDPRTGHLHREPSLLVVIAIREDAIPLARELAADMGRELKQKAVYFAVRPIQVEIIDLDD